MLLKFYLKLGKGSGVSKRIFCIVSQHALLLYGWVSKSHFSYGGVSKLPFCCMGVFKIPFCESILHRGGGGGKIYVVFVYE